MPRQKARHLQRRRTPCCLGGTAGEIPIEASISREAILKSFIGISLLSLALSAPALAQGLVDPSKVAPEFREAAEKRRAEQIRQRDCAKKAEAEKVIPRDRTAFLLHCLDEMAAASTPAAAVTTPTPAAAATTATAH